jgi:large subunit ribosomal protein L18
MRKRADRNTLRQQRHLRIRRGMAGAPERPRLSVYRSLDHIYAQIVDDRRGMTLAAASTLDASIRPGLDKLKKTESGKLVGKLIAERALAQGIKRVVFDRGGYLYHGRVKAVADAAREGGLEF